MTPEILAIIMFVTTLLFLLFGFPVAFTLAGSALIFAFIGDLLDIFNFRMLFFFPQRIYGIMINEALVAVPLFIFMGVMLEKTNIAAKLLVSIGDLFGSVRGGLGIGVVLVGMLLAASTGIVGATVVTMGMLALPTMIKAGYDEKIATGTICASGTLGQIIPPSIVLILLAEMLQGANEEAGLMTGDLAPLPRRRGASGESLTPSSSRVGTPSWSRAVFSFMASVAESTACKLLQLRGRVGALCYANAPGV